MYVSSFEEPGCGILLERGKVVLRSLFRHVTYLQSAPSMRRSPLYAELVILLYGSLGAVRHVTQNFAFREDRSNRRSWFTLKFSGADWGACFVTKS